MPAPRVFISSTCYDLRYIRENLKFFIKSLGYEPVLSEEGAVFYDPTLNVQDACLGEVPSCQLFVLIIGGRSGGRYKDSEKSITNAEYSEAARGRIPIFALVERSVYEQFRLFMSNNDNSAIDPNKISYPAVDSTKIFAFIEEVQGQSVNNALVPFSDFEEMQSYLKQQWAGLLYRFLTSESEAKRVGGVLESLSAATANIEFLTRQVVQSVGDPITKATVEFYDLLLAQEVVRDLATWGLRPSPQGIVAHETFESFCGNLVEVYPLEPGKENESSLTYGGPPYKLSRARLVRNQKDYEYIRAELLRQLQERGISASEFMSKSVDPGEARAAQQSGAAAGAARRR
jgi:hypothetical protein